MEFTYDPPLVVLSIAVAILGFFTGLVMMTGIRAIRGPEAAIRILLGGIGIGGGAWAMHFVAMMAVVLPVKLSYEVYQSAVSALIVVVFTVIALASLNRRDIRSHTLAVSALFLGAGISSMHYLGMNAVRGGVLISYSWLGVAVSVIIAAQVSAVALWFAFRERGVTDTFLGAIALGLAVASMHYATMEATRFLPGEEFGETLHNVVSDAHLAMIIAVGVYIVCGISIAVFAALAFARRNALRRHGRATR